MHARTKIWVSFRLRLMHIMILKSPQSNVDQLNWSFNMDRAKREIFKNQTLNQFTEIAATTQSFHFY